MMPRHHFEVCQRDDGLWQIGIDDSGAGPFETRTFAVRIAGGQPPTPAKRANFRKIEIREVPRAASA